MALPSENQIMSEIGLGQHYDYFNGSGSSKYIRESALRELPIKIKQYIGEELDPRFKTVLQEISASERPNMLTKTWQAVSEVISHYTRKVPEDTKESLEKEKLHLLKYLSESYLGKEYKEEKQSNKRG